MPFSFTVRPKPLTTRRANAALLGLRHRLLTSTEGLLDEKVVARPQVETLLYLLDFSIRTTIPALSTLPHRSRYAASGPLAIAVDYLSSHSYSFCRHSFRAYFCSVRDAEALENQEIELALPTLQIACLCKLSETRLAGENHEQVATLFNTARETALLIQSDFAASLFSFEDVLLDDPAGTYGRMDWNSRAEYRNAVQEIASRSGTSLSVVAQTAYELAMSANEKSPHATIERHIGFYLIDDGRTPLFVKLNKTAQTRPLACRWERWANESVQWARIFFYWLGLGLVSAAIAWALTFAFGWGPSHLFLTAILLVVAIERINPLYDHVLSSVKGARELPCVDYIENGVPDDRRVLIAVPTLLISKRQIDAVLETARWNWLASNDSNVEVALLSDFVDADEHRATPQDNELLAYCRKQVQAANDLCHAQMKQKPFLLLHRRRTWSATQGRWIGWERKRGKLDQLNDLIVSGRDAFEAEADAVRRLRSIRYVLCLDDDVRLGRDAVQVLAGSIAHPLNEAKVDEHGRVVRGHGLLTPNGWTRRSSATAWRVGSPVVGPQHDEHGESLPVRNFSFDFFGRNHYAGKGIYDPRIYLAVCSARMPEGRVLSHDTIEAAWLNPGFAGRVCIAEGYPSSYLRLCDRLHRWTRGDWQNLWLLISQSRWVPDHDNGIKIPAVVWFTVLSQIRLLLTPLALTIAIVFALSLGGRRANLAIAAIVALLTLPAWFRLVLNIAADWRRGNSLGLMQRSLRFAIDLHLAQAYRVLVAPHHGLIALDAAVRTVARIYSGKQLLEWTAASIIEGQRREPLLADRLLTGVSGLASILGITLIAGGRGSTTACLVIGLWLLSPWLCRALTKGTS